MFNMIELHAEMAANRQQELRDLAERSRLDQRDREPNSMLAALGRQLVSLGERLQHAPDIEQRTYHLHTERA